MFAKASGKLTFMSSLLFLFLNFSAGAQCINTFPYVEDFENAPAWTAVSVANGDWAWGTPNHTYLIQSAGSGNKCWSSGNLTGASYNFWEQAYVVSPCFDFSNLQYPHIKFKIFYETEFHFDGGNLQYSINGGSSWTNVGSANDPVDCNTQNWYNHNNITYLNNPAWVPAKHGWSGNVQSAGSGWDPSNPSASCVGGNGSGQWLTAEHCLNGLGGQSNVLLRFTFAAGYSCNNFDGFAFDSVSIAEGTPVLPDFTFTCSGSSFNFTSSASSCPTPTAWNWNFGDGTSSSVQNPTHTFPAQGTYTVTLTSSGGACNPPGLITHTVSTLIASAATVNNVSCNGGYDGSAIVNVSPAGNAYTYNWSPYGGNNASAVGLSAGTYTVMVTDTEGCVSTAQVSITQPAALAAYTASDYTADIYNSTINFFDNSPNGISWNWNFGDGNTSTTQNPTHLFENSGSYPVVLTVSYPNGCIDSVVHIITILEDFTFYVPNAFSPNEDEKNDVFKPIGLGWQSGEYRFRIYDRWGHIIFETDDTTMGWKGTDEKSERKMPVGVYVWTVELYDNTGVYRSYNGHVTLVK